MRYIWNFFDHKDWSTNRKYRACRISAAFLYGLLGFLIWSLLKTWILKDWTWMLTFTGWPAFFGYLGVFFYSGRHIMHEGKPASSVKIPAACLMNAKSDAVTL